MTKLFVLTFTFTLIIIIFIWFKISTNPAATVTEFKTFVIPEGETLTQIAKRLKNEGLIKNALAFRILAASSGFAKKIQAGSFQLSPSLKAAEIAKELTSGTFDVWITIPEGWRVEEIGQRLEEKLGVDKGEFVKSAKEGYMFPDTYLIPKKATAAEVAKIMRDNFEARVDANLRKLLANSGLTLEQAIILASIVEREVKFAQDRSIVAGILVKRWRNNLGLEADATVQYAVGFQKNESSWWKSQLTANDLKIDSPYNTRRFAGLPPTPICNPGLASIKAVVAPFETDFLYYVSDSEGKIHYAKTLPEHIENIRSFL